MLYEVITGTWEVIDNVVVDKVNRRVSGTTTHFSLFGLRGRSGLTPAELPRQIYALQLSENGRFNLVWNAVDGDDVLYELQQAGDAAFTQGVVNLS